MVKIPVGNRVHDSTSDSFVFNVKIVPFSSRTSRRQAVCLLLICLFIHSCLTLYLILAHRMVRGHDTFQYFITQYFFLNHAVQTGEIPQWIPYMTHGTIATWWYVIQSGVSQNILFGLAPLLKHVNFMPVFYAGMWIDGLILLIGTWLLARRFFSSAQTCFLVTISVLGSSIWMDQVWWNFHLYYALPLLLYLMHQFVDTARWRYFFLAGNLLFVQSFGNLPYFLPLTTFVVASYWTLYLIFNRQIAIQQMKQIPWGWPAAVSLCGSAGLLCLYWMAVTSGTDQLAIHLPGRESQGVAPLHEFLTYGGTLKFGYLSEFLLRISPRIEQTLYIGLLTLPLGVVAIASPDRRRAAHFAVLAILLLFFSLGTWVTIACYHGWPFMKYFRHVMYAIALLKLPLIFLAGFGWEQLLSGAAGRKRSFLVLMIAAGLLGTLFIFAHFHPTARLEIVRRLFSIQPWIGGEIDNYGSYYEALIPFHLNWALVISLAYTLLFLLAFLSGNSRRIPILLWFVLITHALDMTEYNWSESRFKTTPLPPSLYRLQYFQPISFPAQRDTGKTLETERMNMLHALAIRSKSNPDAPAAYYAYPDWSFLPYLFADKLDSVLRTDHWLQPLDQFIKAYLRQPVSDTESPPGTLSAAHALYFPSGHPAAAKIAGADAKLQFFAEAYGGDSADWIATKLADPGYAAGILFLGPDDAKEKSEDITPWNPSHALDSESRVQFPYQVKRFTANRLELEVRNPESRPVWLLYSDVWHPFWKATVNGTSFPVQKANLAYKAVRVPPGQNNVRLHFSSQLMSLTHLFLGLNSMAWIFGLFIFMFLKIRSNGKNGMAND